VRFKLYIHDRQTGEVYREPLRVDVFQKRFLKTEQRAADPIIIEPGTGPEKNDYKFYFSFPEPEAYEVRVTFPNAEQMEVIPFPVMIGKTDDRPLIFGAIGLLGLAVVSVGTAKRLQRKSRRRRKS